MEDARARDRRANARSSTTSGGGGGSSSNSDPESGSDRARKVEAAAGSRVFLPRLVSFVIIGILTWSAWNAFVAPHAPHRPAPLAPVPAYIPTRLNTAAVVVPRVAEIDHNRVELAEEVAPPAPEGEEETHSEVRSVPLAAQGGERLRIHYLCTPHIALLPLVAYGGGEASCEAEIEGLSKLRDLSCVDFVAVVPRRNTYGRHYSFPIIESAHVGDSGENFINEYVDHLHRKDPSEWPHMIWCQSEWCPTTLRDRDIQIPIIATLHHGDCGECREHGPMVRYRMPSAHAFSRSVQRQGWMSDRAFVVWQAFLDAEFQFNEKQGDYVLWVGGCGWYHEKGVPEFERLSLDNPDVKFVLYCSGHEEKADIIREFARNHPNFEFRGELKRGKDHNEAFANAKAFFFWTQMGGETFGRVAVEALAKGTPVIGSATMANPETIIQNEGGVISNDLADLQAALHHDFDRQVVYKTAQRFRSKLIVRQLLEETKRMLADLKDQSRITTNVEDFMVFNFDGYGTESANRCWAKAN